MSEPDASFAVEYDQTPKGNGGPTTTKTKTEYFDEEEEDARRFARSLRSDVWNSLGGVILYRIGNGGWKQIAASFDDDHPL